MGYSKTVQRQVETRIIGITMGCPVGIGPEIIIRFLSGFTGTPSFNAVVLGDCGVLAESAALLGIKARIVEWLPGQPIEQNSVNVLALSNLDGNLAWGSPSRETGRAMARYIEEAVHLIQTGALAGMATCPISKAALHKAGYTFPGHTEMLASLCGTSDFAMMMAGERLRVILVTIHNPLRNVPEMVTRKEVLRLIRMSFAALQRDFGITNPRIAVAALNPHAGEEGLFGDEEEREIAPAVAEAAANGWPVSGPYPPDTVFHRAANGEFDAVVCMYHDQGLIPFKLLHFEDGVNVTLGLPIVRTSVDHGTAYDIAGKGLASSKSLEAAWRMASDIVTNRHHFDLQNINA